MYTLIRAKLATMTELKTMYTLDEALKLYALYSMDRDIEQGQIEEMNAKLREK